MPFLVTVFYTDRLLCIKNQARFFATNKQVNFSFKIKKDIQPKWSNIFLLNAYIFIKHLNWLIENQMCNIDSHS